VDPIKNEGIALQLYSRQAFVVTPKFLRHLMSHSLKNCHSFELRDGYMVLFAAGSE